MFIEAVSAEFYIFSPNIDIDDTWLPVKQYIASEWTEAEDEQIYLQDFDGEAVQNIWNTQTNNRSPKKGSEQCHVSPVKLIAKQWKF